MFRRLTLVVLTVALGWLYWSLLVAAIGFAAALPVSGLWLSLFPTRQAALLTWMVTVHTLAILLVSIPFGFLIQWMWGRRGVVVALAITLAVFSLQLPYIGELFRGQPLRFQIVAAFDQLKLLGVLPFAVWLISLLPSNFRWGV
jgi:hypothetical protein